MLEVKNLHTYYGNIKALRGVSFHVEEGEILSFIGSNGAGKSTLMNTLVGTLKPVQGEIIFNGEDITKMTPKQRVEKGIVLCPEGRQIFPKFTVEENLLMGAYTDKDKARVKRNYARALKLFPVLEERQKQLAGTLSGGEQQMLAVARGLMSNPKLMMFDEPSLGLSPILVEQIFALIEEIHKEGTTILLVEQNAMAALQIADRAYVLETGEITIEGTGKELLNNDVIIKSYLGA